MAGCGYTPADIDAMPMRDVMALVALWRETPPTHEILAAVYGVRPAPIPTVDDPSGIGALIARAGGSGETSGVKRSLSPASGEVLR